MGLYSINNSNNKKDLFSITLDKGMEYIKENKAILLDVRVPSNVKGKNAQEANIPNAFYIPYTDFINYIDILPEDKKKPIIVASYEGWFANRVKSYLEMLGFDKIYVLSDNIEEWIKIHTQK